MRLVFVGSTEDVEILKKRLDADAGPGWAGRGDIVVVGVKGWRNPLEVRARLKEVLRPACDTRLYLLRADITFDSKHLPQPLSVTTSPGKLKVFLKQELRPALQRIGADWRSRIESILQAWEFPDPDEVSDPRWAEYRVDRWLSQFDRLTDGACRWIGEALLHSFEFVTRADFINAFKGAAAAAACVMRYDNGKSADAISGILKKGVLKNTGKVENFDELVRRAQLPEGKVVVYEDGLFSGTEWVGIFASLLGATDGQHEKCSKLDDPSVLVNMDLEIHFAVATTVGLAFLKRALAKLGLHRVQLAHSNEALDVLSPLGKTRLADETLFSDDGKIAPDSVLPRVFQTAAWGQRGAEAAQYCDAIGRDLWASYWTRKNKPISPDMLDRVALGASNLAFAMAFPFSLPKVTLPVFWCAGDVKGHSKSISWEPLFPNAA